MASWLRNLPALMNGVVNAQLLPTVVWRLPLEEAMIVVEKRAMHLIRPVDVVYPDHPLVYLRVRVEVDRVMVPDKAQLMVRYLVPVLRRPLPREVVPVAADRRNPVYRP